MIASSFNLMKYSLKSYTHHSYKRLITNSILYGSDKDPDKQKENIIIKKFSELNDWYIKFTGLDEIKRLQDRVVRTQVNLEKAQTERREIGKLLVEVRKKGTELQEQLHNVKRWENTQRFLDLTRQETEVMKEEKELTARFEVLDKVEREIFTALSNAVWESHEKEKARSEYTKYWGIILSITGTIIGAVASSLISTIRNHQLVSGINKGVEHKINEITGMIKQDGNNSLGNIDYIIKEIKDDYSKTCQIILQKLVYNQNQLDNLLKSSGTQYFLPANEIKNEKYLDINSFANSQINLLEQHQSEIKKLLIFNVCVVSIILFLGLLGRG